MNTFNSAIVVLLRKRVNFSIENNSAILQGGDGFLRPDTQGRNNFNGWLLVWKIDVPEGYPYKGHLLQFVRKSNKWFTNLIENE